MKGKKEGKKEKKEGKKEGRSVRVGKPSLPRSMIPVTELQC